MASAVSLNNTHTYINLYVFYESTLEISKWIIIYLISLNISLVYVCIYICMYLCTCMHAGRQLRRFNTFNFFT